MTAYAHITGWGMALPSRRVSNGELAGMVDTSDEWIFSRTGIRERRVACDGETTTSLATEAALQALECANLNPTEVELIIVATSTPEHLFPSTACKVQDSLGASHAGAFDLLAACTGFIYALNTGLQAIRSGSVCNALIIGAETLSKRVDWNDRNTCILFGDGAGAFVLQGSTEPGGVLSSITRSDGSGADLLTLPAGDGNTPFPNGHTLLQLDGHPTIQMNGREVFRFATKVMAQATLEALSQAHLTLSELHWIIPHQANQRIIDAAARSLEFPIERFLVNLEQYGNTSAASIPIAACEAAQKGKLRPGDRVMMVGFGGGLTWGAVLAEWTGPILTRHRIRPSHYQRIAPFRSFLLRLLRRVEAWLWDRHEGPG